MKFLKSALCFVALASLCIAAEVSKKVAAGDAVIIDVREPAEWAESGVAEPAVLLPMSDFNGDQKLWKPFLEANAGKDLIVYCRSGARSGRVAAKLIEQGHTVENAGGFKEWESAKLPVRKFEPAKK